MLVDLSLTTFEVASSWVVEIGVAAEAAGADGLWVTDHFSGAVVGRRWSRDPFVSLGALAQTTERVRLGPLVLNVRNRHPAQTASAINSLASFAPGRVVLGLGAGASPGSRFAVEHEAIGTDLGTAESRRAALIDHLAEVRRVHRLPVDDDDPLAAVTDGSPCPPVVVGASARSTLEVAVRHADGVNLRVGPTVTDLVAEARTLGGPRFEVSVLVDRAVGPSDLANIAAAGADRIVVGVDAATGPADVADVVDRIRAQVER